MRHDDDESAEAARLLGSHSRYGPSLKYPCKTSRAKLLDPKLQLHRQFAIGRLVGRRSFDKMAICYPALGI